MSDDPDLSAVARALAAREPVDWSAAENNVPDPESAAILHELRIVAEIAGFYRTPAVGPNGPIGADAQSDRWGPLRITRLIGSGSFGDVYEAQDPSLDRVVALKLLRAVEASNNRDDAEVVHEGRLLARVRHPHVVTVFGAARIDGRTGIWMEFIKGQTLADRTARSGPMSASDAAAVARDVCLGLSAIHDAGMVHRDIKAQNVMQEDGGRIVLMDLGAGFERARAGAKSMIGTPLYLAPEVLRGEAPTIQSDVYSVGVLLWHLTTGGYPVQGASIDELRSAHLAGQRVAVREVRPNLPRGFASIVEHALATAPADRFRDARAIADALERFIDQPAGRGRMLLAGATVLAVAAVVSVAVRWADLRSHPTIDQPKVILVGSFDNHTGKDLFDRTIQAGLEYELARSQVLSVAESIRVDDALRFLKQPLDSPLTPALAREVARLDRGIQLVIAGSVDTHRGSDVIEASVTDPVTGATRISTKVRVVSDAQAKDALRELALDLRRRLGDTEEANMVRNGPALSLESLRDYSDAVALGNRGNWSAALAHARQAVDRDRTFSMAQIWCAWSLLFSSQKPATAEVLETAVAAEAAAADLPTHQREWILASAAALRHEEGPAILHFEAALKAKADRSFVVDQLLIFYQQSGSPDQAATVSAQAADLQPSNFRQQVNAARFLLTANRDAAVVMQYYTRALDLLNADTAKLRTLDASLALFVPAELAWRDRNAEATTAALVHIVSDPRTFLTEALASNVFARVADLYLAMGQITSARGILSRISQPHLRDLALATADHYSGDLKSEQQHLDQACHPDADPSKGPPGSPACVLRSIESGQLDETQGMAKIKAARWDPPSVRASLGELALVNHRPDDAIQLLPEAIDRLHTASPAYYQAVRALSDAWLQKHQLETAIGTIRSRLSRRSKDTEAGAFLEATALSFRLAALYRVAGDTKAADAVETEAMRGLERADPGFVDRLRDLARAGLDR